MTDYRFVPFKTCKKWWLQPSLFTDVCEKYPAEMRIFLSAWLTVSCINMLQKVSFRDIFHYNYFFSAKIIAAPDLYRYVKLQIWYVLVKVQIHHFCWPCLNLVVGIWQLVVTLIYPNITDYSQILMTVGVKWPEQCKCRSDSFLGIIIKMNELFSSENYFYTPLICPHNCYFL